MQENLNEINQFDTEGLTTGYWEDYFSNGRLRWKGYYENGPELAAGNIIIKVENCVIKRIMKKEK